MMFGCSQNTTPGPKVDQIINGKTCTTRRRSRLATVRLSIIIHRTKLRLKQSETYTVETSAQQVNLVLYYDALSLADPRTPWLWWLL